MKRSFLFTIFFISLFSSLNCQDNNASMKINYQGKDYTQEELEPILEKARIAFDEKLLRDQDYYKIVKVTDPNVISKFKKENSSYFFNKDKIIFSSKYKKGERNYNSVFSDFLWEDICGKRYTDDAIISFYQNLERDYKFKMLHSGDLNGGHCNRIKNSRKLQDFFLTEMRKIGSSIEEKRNIRTYPELDFMISYRIPDYRKELTKHLQTNDINREKFPSVDDYLIILFDDGYEEESFAHFQYIIKSFENYIKKGKKPTTLEPLYMNKEMLSRFYYSSDAIVSKKAIEYSMLCCEDLFKGTYAFYNVLESLCKTDLLNKMQRKKIVDLIIEHRAFTDIIGQTNSQSSLENLVFREFYDLNTLENKFSYSKEQLDHIKRYREYVKSNIINLAQIKSDLRFFDLYDEDFKFNLYKAKAVGFYLGVKPVFSGDLARKMMQHKERYFAYDTETGNFNIEKLFEKNNRAILEKVSNILGIDILEQKDSLNNKKISFILNDNLMFQSSFQDGLFYGAENQFLPTCLNLILKEKDKLERLNSVQGDMEIRLLLDPGVFLILNEKYKVGSDIDFSFF